MSSVPTGDLKGGLDNLNDDQKQNLFFEMKTLFKAGHDRNIVFNNVISMLAEIAKQTSGGESRATETEDKAPEVTNNSGGI